MNQTTTQRGLGWSHQKRRAHLLRNLVDGTPCPCITDSKCGTGCPCAGTSGLPMHRDPHRNIDGMPLEADHGVLARSLGGKQLADRLMLATCNRSRGNGTRQAGSAFTPVLTSRDW